MFIACLINKGTESWKNLLGTSLTIDNTIGIKRFLLKWIKYFSEICVDYKDCLGQALSC